MPISAGIGTNGMTELKASRVYIDANVFIYAAEGSSEIADPLQSLFRLFAVKVGVAVTSELTLAEVLPKADILQRRYYLNLIAWSGVIEAHPISRDIVIETASYRRIAGMPKLADAIHIVTAMRSGCSQILSGDLRMKLPDGLSIIGIDRENISRLINELS
ncbi:MAG TPA: PIN domain-containing protein [Rhodopseudomonas sp.]|uniref:type II toxin-antitoxin system VapC family toxin n=1 Tax=Rhodopseudomonas sp. TaxID=1078 RepID=UPI002EDB2CC6